MIFSSILFSSFSYINRMTYLFTEPRKKACGRGSGAATHAVWIILPFKREDGIYRWKVRGVMPAGGRRKKESSAGSTGWRAGQSDGRGLLSAAEHTGNRYAVFHEISSSVGNIRTFIHLKNHHLSFSDAAFITVAAGGCFQHCPLDL